MSEQPGRLPALSQVGWTFGRGYLPFPADRDLMWDIVSDIMDSSQDGVMVLAHHNADLDAVATALVLKWTFPWVRLGAFRSISQPGRKLLTFFDMEMEVDPDLKDISLLIMVDSSSPMQVIDGEPSEWPKFRVIDHHQDNSHWEGHQYIDDTKGACVEIALQMAMLTNSPLTIKMAMVGIAGIVADTGKYRFASPVDLEVTSFLLSGSDTTMEDVLSVIEGEDYFDVSKKVAQLKAMRRVQYQKVGDQIVAVSRVNSFEAAACRTLLVAGADVSFVSADKKDELRVSARAKPHILKLGVHLGQFMEMIGNLTNNQGGGHDGAAGLNGKGDPDEVLNLCLREMSKLLSTKLGVETPQWRNGGRSHRSGGRDRRRGRSGNGPPVKRGEDNTPSDQGPEPEG